MAEVSQDDDHDQESSPTAETGTGGSWPRYVLTAIAAAVVGVLLGWLVFSPAHPSDTSADAGFSRDMQEHHAQAVEMSLIIIENGVSDDVIAVARDIAVTQAGQMGRMETWLTEWGLSQAHPDPSDRMAWMGDHADHLADLPDGVPMAGMASPAEMEQLREASGIEAEVLFLQLMLTHHIAGVEMAIAGRDLARDSEVVRVADTMAFGQATEIALMLDKLADRGAEARETPEELEAAMQLGLEPPDDGGNHNH